jgi:hypothetical protein
VVRSCARHQRGRQLRSCGPYRASRNPSTAERRACGECAVGAAGCEARGSGSMCRWRRSAVVRIPAFRAGHREGRNAATPGRNGIRNAVSGATRRRPRRRAGDGGKRGIVDGAQLQSWVKLSRGCLKPRAMGRDSVGRSWTIAAGRQVSLRQERRLHTAVKPSADEVPLGWGRARGEACPDGLA